MRPITLKLSAFGPYVYEEIDLDTLGNQGIYLITGDTGAGKTTIFDAITYALYGNASGDIREPNMFRCKYADTDTQTYVELVFEYSGKLYCVRRNPEYERKAKRGSGTTKQVATAELRLPDGKVVTKITEVNLAIEEIMGITCEQFTQIAMIAQGEFLKLLHASTEERLTIFRKIFQTGNYQKLQYKIKDDANKLYREYDRLYQGIEQYVEGIQCEEKLEGSISEKIKNIESYIETDKKQEQILENTISRLEDRKQKVVESIQQFMLKHEKEKELGILDTDFQRSSEIFKTHEKSYNEHVNREEAREHLRQNINDIKREIAKYAEYKKLEVELNREKKAIESNENKLKEQQSFIDKQQNVLQELEKEKIKFADIKITYSENYEKLNEIKKVTIEINKLLESYKSLQKLYTNNEEKKEQYIKLSNVAMKIEEEYIEKNKAYLDEQAGILAIDLEEGMPCPVCGATHHLLLAQLTQDAPTKEQLKLWKDKSEVAKKEMSRVSEELAVARNRADNLYTQMKIDIDRIAPHVEKNRNMKEVIEELYFEIKEQARVLEETGTQLKKQVHRLEELETLIPKVNKSIDDTQKDFHENEKNGVKLNTNKEHRQELISNLEKEFTYSSQEEANSLLSQNESKLEMMKKEYELVKKQFLDSQSKLDRLKGRQQELRKSIAEIKNVDMEALSQEKEKIELERAGLKEKQKEVSSFIRNNQYNLGHIIEKRVELEKVEIKYQWMKELSDTANGNLSKKEKIMLETYIQMAYFDRIIRRANIRLLKMTSDQYELKRQVEVGASAGKKGLDLNVIDYYNGSERSVKTLSGGESFKASLALALGLADEIQSLAGGIKLDTMFVDEGFGSLDEESLQQAIQVLIGLADGNRLVGIISHVDELKEKIDKQLIIRKNGINGSTHRIIDKS